MKLSIIIPAYNEAGNILECIKALQSRLDQEGDIPYEIICVNDNSTDETAELVAQAAAINPRVRLIGRTPPGGFGRAIRSGLQAVTGDVVAIFMADLSDSPDDVIACYRKIFEGYDCVFGSRFMKGSTVRHYPWFKYIVNRIVNHTIQWMFWTKFNDLTNAFKVYRTEVIQECGPLRASHFNITLELSLNVLIRQYDVAQIPISWEGRTWGCSNLRLRVMGRKYLCTLLMVFFQKILIRDDILAEKVASKVHTPTRLQDLEERLQRVEQAVEAHVPATDASGFTQDATDASDFAPTSPTKPR